MFTEWYKTLQDTQPLDINLGAMLQSEFIEYIVYIASLSGGSRIWP